MALISKKLFQLVILVVLYLFGVYFLGIEATVIDGKNIPFFDLAKESMNGIEVTANGFLFRANDYLVGIMSFPDTPVATSLLSALSLKNEISLLPLLPDSEYKRSLDIPMLTWAWIGAVAYLLVQFLFDWSTAENYAEEDEN